MLDDNKGSDREDILDNLLYFKKHGSFQKNYSQAHAISRYFVEQDLIKTPN